MLRALGCVLRIYLLLQRTVAREINGIPQGLKPGVLGCSERPKAKALGYLEAKTLIHRTLPNALLLD